MRIMLMVSQPAALTLRSPFSSCAVEACPTCWEEEEGKEVKTDEGHPTRRSTPLFSHEPKMAWLVRPESPFQARGQVDVEVEPLQSLLLLLVCVVCVLVAGKLVISNLPSLPSHQSTTTQSVSRIMSSPTQNQVAGHPMASEYMRPAHHVHRGSHSHLHAPSPHPSTHTKSEQAAAASLKATLVAPLSHLPLPLTEPPLPLPRTTSLPLRETATLAPRPDTPRAMETRTARKTTRTRIRSRSRLAVRRSRGLRVMRRECCALCIRTSLPSS